MAVENQLARLPIFTQSSFNLNLLMSTLEQVNETPTVQLPQELALLVIHSLYRLNIMLNPHTRLTQQTVIVSHTKLNDPQYTIVHPRKAKISQVSHYTSYYDQLIERQSALPMIGVTWDIWNETCIGDVSQLCQQILEQTPFLELLFLNLEKLILVTNEISDIVATLILVDGSSNAFGKPEITKLLFRGLFLLPTTQICFEILTKYLKHPTLVQSLLEYHIQDFFRGMESSHFEIISRSCSILKELLLPHYEGLARLSSAYVISHHEEIFALFHRVIRDPENLENSVESLKILSGLLLEKNYFDVMIKYTTNKDNLIVVMKLLLSLNVTVRIEAFHIFKLFIVNCFDSVAVFEVLVDNKQQIIRYFNSFKEKSFFNDEISQLTYIVSQLPDKTAKSSSRKDKKKLKNSSKKVKK